MNPQQLLQQFLGPDAGANVSSALQSAKSKAASSGVTGIAGGLAAGGVLGLLLGNKKARKKVGKLAGGALGYGGAAALGALAHRAYSNWQSNRDAPPPPAPAAAPALPPAGSRFLPETAPAGNGQPFEVALVLAMIGAANADGHIDAEEQRRIFEQVSALPLDAEAKAFVFDALRNPPGLNDIAAMADGPEQAVELWLASRLAIDVDHPAEEAYLEALASRLSLSRELVKHLESQAAAV